MRKLLLLLLLVLLASGVSANFSGFTDQLADQKPTADTQLQNFFFSQLAAGLIDGTIAESSADIALNGKFAAKLTDKTSAPPVKPTAYKASAPASTESSADIALNGKFAAKLSDTVAPQDDLFGLATALADKEHAKRMLVNFRNCADQKGSAEFVLNADHKTDVVLSHGKARVVLRSVAGETLDAFIDTYAGEDTLTTPVFAANAEIELAEIALPKNGPVNAILKCDNFDVNGFTCTGEWINSKLPFVDNGTHVIFNATSFSGYGGGNITIINVQSYPRVGGNWDVLFNTTGTANLTITAFNGTTWSDTTESEDLKFLEVRCGETVQTYTWINDAVFIEDYSCDNITGTETSKVLTSGVHTLEFRFGYDIAYAYNNATDFGTIAQIYDTVFGADGDPQEIALNLSTETILDPPYNHTEVANLTFNEAGIFKISYGVTWVSTVGGVNRRIMRNWIRKNGTEDVVPSETRCYIRNNLDGRFCSNAAVLLYNASAGDFISLMGVRDHGTAGITITASDVWMYAQKVTRDVAQIYDNAGGDDIDNTTIRVRLEGETVVDPIFTHVGNATNVSQAGIYKIYYTVNTDLTDVTADSDRRTIKTNLRLNGGPGNITPSASYSYIRDEVTGDQNHNTGFLLVNLTAGDEIEILAHMEDSVEIREHTTMQNLSWLLIERVGTGDVLQVRESIGGQSVAENGLAAIDFDTNDFVGESFHRPAANNITFNNSGWFEISYTTTWDDNNVGGRALISTFLRHNGVTVRPSNQTDYSRGANSATLGRGRFQTNAANFLLNITAGDSIQLFMQPVGAAAETEPNGSYLTIIPAQAAPLLKANVLTPTPDVILQVLQNSTFDFNITVECTGISGTCGEVFVVARYNSTQGEPDTNISRLFNDTPFVIIQSRPDNDVVVALQSTTNELRLYEFSGGVWRETTNITDQPGGIEALEVGDADNDGLNEIVIGVDSDNQVKIVDFNEATSTWVVTDVSGPQAWHVEDVSIGDADNDGLNEIIAGFERTGTGQPTTGVTPLRKYDFVDGAWEETNITPSNEHNSVQWVDIGDPDDDGFNEVVALYANVTSDSGHMSRVTMYENSTSPWIQINVTPLLGGQDARAERMIIGDVDNDGREEIISSHWNDTSANPGGRITLYENDTSANWDPTNISVNTGLVDGITIGDVNGDGRIDLGILYDLVVAAAGPNQVRIYENISGGFVETNLSEQLTGLGRDIDFGDANNDGLIDVIAAQDQPLFLYENVTKTQINTTIQTFTVDIDSADVADPDNDGRLNNLSCGTMNVGDICQINYTIKATGDVDTFWLIDINVTSTSTSVAGTDSENPIINIVGEAVSNISLTKADTPDPVNTSSQLNYVINVTSFGSKTAFNVTLVDTYPDQVIFQSAEPTPEAGTNNTFFLGNLTSSQVVKVNITVLVNNITNGTVINNTANATFQDTDDVSFNTLVTENTTVLLNTLSVNITTNATLVTAALGNNVTYLITVGNNGTLTNTFNLTVQNIDGAAVAVINESVVTLAPDQTATFIHTVSNSVSGFFNTTVTAIEFGRSDINATTQRMESRFIDVTPPNVTSLLPARAEFNNTNLIVNITADVRDDVAVDVVRANVTLPNSSLRIVVMTDPNSDSVFNASFTETSLTGQYNFTILANDTSGNLNDSESSFFAILAPLTLVVDADQNQYSQGTLALITVNATDNASQPIVADVITDIIYGNLTIPQPAPWFNTSFDRRIPINISEQTNISNLTGFVANFTIDTFALISAGTMRSDCGDIRFAEFFNNNTAELDYEIDPLTCNTTETHFFVGLPELNEDRLIFMYFSNSLITSSSSEAVFDISKNVTKFVLSNTLALNNLSIISYVDNNNITINGTEVLFLDRGEFAIITTAQFSNSTVITGTGPFDGVFNDTSGNNGDNLAPLVYAGKEFTLRHDRSTNPVFPIIAPFADANVQIFNDTSLVPVINTNITKGVFTVLGPVTGIPNAIIFEANESVIIRWEGTITQDYHLIYPAHTDFWGVPTGFLELAALENGTNVSVLTSSGGNVTYNLSRGQTIEDSSFGTEGNSDAVHIISNRRVGAYQEADGDGTETSTFLPERELNSEYYLPLPASYITIAATQPSTNCTVFHPNGTVTTQTSTAQPRPFPNAILFGATGVDDIEFEAGSRLTCDAPIFAMFEFQPDNVAVAGGAETNLFGTKSGRQILEPMPIATALNETFIVARDINTTNASGLHEFTFDTTTQPLGNYTVVTQEGKFFQSATDFDNFEIIEAVVVPILFNLSNVSINKTDNPDPVNAGAQLNYTINVTSTGNGTAFNVTVNDTYPSQVIFDSAAPAPLSGTNNTFILGNLSNGTSVLINITVNVSSGVSNGTVINNTVNATFQNETSQALVNVTDIEPTTVLAPIINASNISVIKTDNPDPVNNGSQLNYTINVTSTGTGTAFNVTVNDTYPSQVIFDSAAPAPLAGTNNTFVLGNMTPGTSTLINITVNVSDSVPNKIVINNTVNVSFQNETSQIEINRTAAEGTTVITNTVPIVENVTLNSTFGTNFTTENLTAFFDSFDLDGDNVKNITNFLVDNISITLVNMPFEANRANESASAKDYSPNSNNGTVNGAVFNSTGGVDGFGAYDFDTNTDFIEINTSEFRTGNMTFMAWAIADAFLPSPHYVFGHTTQPAFANRIQLYTDFGGVLSVGLGNVHALGSGTNLSSGALHHVTLAFNDTEFFAYLDGALDFSGTFEGLTTFAGFMDIGNDGSTTLRNEAWDGIIDEVVIFNRTLSAEQIFAIFNNRTTTIVSNETEINEIWQACVTPNDRTEDGTEVCSNNVTIVPEVAVSVINLAPTAGTQFLLNQTVNITANATTTSGTINIVSANVTLPNGTVIVVPLDNGSIDIFNGTFSGDNLNQRGQYNITYFANDTNGNINATITTNFFRNSLDVIDIRMQLLGTTEGAPPTFVFANYSTTVVSNISGILNLSISINGSRITQVNVTSHDEASISSILDIDDWEQDAPTSAVYAIEPGSFNFTGMLNVTVNASGRVFRKCGNWNFTGRDCLGTFEIQQNITPGQLYTFEVNSTDPGFLESSPSVDVALAPFDNTTFILASIRNDTNVLEFRIFNTNGSVITNFTVDATVDTDSRVSVANINSTHFVIAWIDGPDNDARQQTYLRNGTNTTGVITVDTNVGGPNNDISVTQLGDRFPVCYANDNDNDADFRVFNNSDGTEIVGETNVDPTMRPQLPLQNLVECTGVNRTRWVYSWFDDAANDASFQRVDENGVDVGGVVDLDGGAGERAQVATTTLDDDKFVVLWYDASSDNIEIAIRDIDNNVILAPTTIDDDPGTESRVALATIRDNATGNTDAFVAVWWNQSSDRIMAAVFNGSGTVITEPFTVDTQPNPTFHLLDVTARDPIGNNSICPLKFIVAYSNSTDQAIFKRFEINGTPWDGICGRPDIFVNGSEIFFNDSNPGENQNITINATIRNIGDAGATSVLVRFFDNTSGQQINGDQTVDISADGSVVVNVTYLTIIGNRTILVAADPENTIGEITETNNNATAQLNVQAYTQFFGSVLGNLTLDDSSLDTFYAWNFTDSGIIYFFDTDSLFNFTDLQALGRNTTNGTAVNDFGEADVNLGMVGFNDSIVDLWATDNSTPFDTRNFTIFSRLVGQVPIINSSNASTFVTGILWDTGDDTDGEYDISDKEDLVFITNINLTKSGASGSPIDYEIHVPSLVRAYRPSANLTAFIAELT